MAESAEYGCDIDSYKLPVCDVQKEKRNYMGVQKDTHYTIEDMQQKNNKFKDNSGHSDTDSVTYSGDKEESVAAIYKKQGKVRDWSGRKLGTEQPRVPNSIDFGR